MAEKIRILIADDIAATRESICKLLEFHPAATVVAQAATAAEAIAQAKAVQPDIILMDVNMPGMDGITAAGLLSTEVPAASVIMMSVQTEQEYLYQAMLAGAKNYLTKPFTGDELLQAIQQAYHNEQRRRNVIQFAARSPELGKIITVFSTKGGIGKTTIATNLAAALAAKTGAKVGLVDADLQFGDISLFLNLLPQATVADLMREEHLEAKVIEKYLTSYSASLQVLAAPFRPEQAKTISGTHLADILAVLRTMFKYVVVDTTPAFNETMLGVLEVSDQVLFISSMDLPAIKNVKLGLEMLESLPYPAEKVKIVLNRAGSAGGMTIREVEESLRHSFALAVPSDGKIVVTAANRGVPFVVSHPEASVSQSIFQIARLVAEGEWKEQADESSGVAPQKLKVLGTRA